MGKKRDPYGVTPAYLAWKRKGSPGVFDLEKDRQVPVEEIRDDPVVALMKELGTPMTRENYLELAYLKKDPVLSAEEEAELPEQFKMRDPEEGVLDLIPIGLGGNKVDVVIKREEDAVDIDCPQTSKTRRHI